MRRVPMASFAAIRSIVVLSRFESAADARDCASRAASVAEESDSRTPRRVCSESRRALVSRSSAPFTSSILALSTACVRSLSRSEAHWPAENPPERVPSGPS